MALPDNITVPMKWRLEPVPDSALLDVEGEKTPRRAPHRLQRMHRLSRNARVFVPRRRPRKSVITFRVEESDEPGGRRAERGHDRGRAGVERIP